MKRNPEYDSEKYIKGCNDHYGVKVTAYFYVGDKIIEGESFGDTEDTAYIDDMGSDWQKGHLLAKSLGGDNQLHNLLPMKEEVNNSSFKKVENCVHTLFDNLDGIQKKCKAGDLHIRYTVERVKGSTMTVKSHKFPGRFSYSIEFRDEKECVIDAGSIKEAIKALNISQDVELSGTLSVE